VYKVWFEDHPPNQALTNQAIKDAFMKGGYYQADINDNLSVLALNSLYLNKK